MKRTFLEAQTTDPVTSVPISLPYFSFTTVKSLINIQNTDVKLQFGFPGLNQKVFVTGTEKTMYKINV